MKQNEHAQIKIAVVGGCNIDISATAYTPIIQHDSNPGFIKTTLGGVGRNIAENLARLGNPVFLVSTLGDDQFKPIIERESREVGLNLSLCETFDQLHTSTYICINQPDGDIMVAISAMDICDHLMPEILSTRLDFLNTCDYVVIDSNIPEQSVEYLAQHCTARLCADTVSTKKAVKLQNALPYLYFLKANRPEAEVLTGMKITSKDDLAAAAAALHHKGIKNVAITLSMDGAFFSNGTHMMQMPPMPSQAVNTTGCGDAFFAGALFALDMQLKAADVLRYGLAMAAISAEADSAVSPILSQERLQAVLQQNQGGNA